MTMWDADKRNLLSKINFELRDTLYCWIWTAGKGKDGYPLVKIARKTRRANRASYIIFRGPIPSGLLVCHKCDEPLCINPHHLFLGDDAANFADAKAKRRHAHGVTSGAAKLSEPEVLAIHAARGTPQKILIAKYGVSSTTISHIQHEKKWKHLWHTDHALRL